MPEPKNRKKVNVFPRLDHGVVVPCRRKMWSEFEIRTPHESG